MLHSRIAMAAIMGLSVASAPARAAEYLTAISSEVYPTQGTAREIAVRANTCMSQYLAPGTVDAQLIISSDVDGGTVVARSALEYGNLPRWKVRSRFTFEARDGRFRIEQTGIERFNDTAGGWSPVGKWTGSGWKKAEAAFVASATVVAQCVQARPKQDDW